MGVARRLYLRQTIRHREPTRLLPPAGDSGALGVSQRREGRADIPTNRITAEASKYGFAGRVQTQTKEIRYYNDKWCGKRHRVEPRHSRGRWPRIAKRNMLYHRSWGTPHERGNQDYWSECLCAGIREYTRHEGGRSSRVHRSHARGNPRPRYAIEKLRWTAARPRQDGGGLPQAWRLSLSSG